MKTASAALIKHLNSSHQFLTADLYTLSLVGGTVVYFTPHDNDLVMSGNTFKVWQVTRSRTRMTTGLEVDTLEVIITPRVDSTIGGMALLPAVLRGVLDGASLTLQRLFMPNPDNTSLGAIHLFSGKVADVEADRLEVKVTVKSELELLNVQLPRNVFQAGCINTLYDTACGINKATRAVTGTLTASTLGDVSTALATDLTLGVIKFTSGVNNGLTRAVRLHQSGRVYFATPLINPCAAGDTFTGWSGCDKQQATCENKFNNRLNFRGFPYIPVPETVL
jgi:uncharacterized phage protein (TIGR02218 family)